ncbi:MAG: MauE/DoxX family redox-associated membrane protein [Geminicoccaceae bacterium]
MSLDPTLALAAALVLAAVFGAAGPPKLAARDAFAGVLANYRLLPDRLVAPVALLLPCLEIAVAAGLLIPATRPLAALGAGLLLLLFAAAMAVNLLRGRSDIDCGCAIGRLRERIGWPLVARNLVLATVALLLVVGTPASRALGWLDGVSVIATVAAALLLHAAAGRLFGLAPVNPLGAR